MTIKLFSCLILLITRKIAQSVHIHIVPEKVKFNYVCNYYAHAL